MADVEVFPLGEVSVAHEPATPGEVVAGKPTLGTTPITTLGDTGVEIGIWEMSTGAVRDIEVDEVFVVLEGAATISVEGAAPVAVKPGDLVRLSAGAATVWEVTSPLRKLYVA
ncbi:cupin domain-containing protein [Actinoplanes sp. NPDC048988]|uniref:cupin domain-containing protein n=1 Tax=Actinoplanes sp. NPDC048988 TaxID=3363901 RepID=UPI003724BE1F